MLVFNKLACVLNILIKIILLVSYKLLQGYYLQI